MKANKVIRRVKPSEVNIEVNTKTVLFEIDMGCSVSIMNEGKFNETWKEKQCPTNQQCNSKPRSHSSHTLGKTLELLVRQ